MATRRSKRQSKVVKAVEEEDTVNTGENTGSVSASEQMVKLDDDSSTKSSEVEMKQEGCEEEEPQMSIEVKGNTSTVTVSWEKKNEDGDEKEEKTLTGSPAGVVESAETTPSQAAEAEMEEECQKDAVTKDSEGESTVTGTCAGETAGGEQTTVKKKEKKKRKADPAAENSPPKKTKLMNDGLSLFVGNLNKSKTSEEVKNSLQNYFIEQSVLFQDIRLDSSRKHAIIDVVSEMDVDKALKLNGEMILDKPMSISRARVKSEKKVKAKPPPLDQNVKDGRCLFLKNVPYKATKKDIMRVFPKAIAIRFPGGAEGPSQGIAFVEFKNKVTAQKARQRKQGVKIQGRVLIVDGVGEANMSVVKKPKADDKKNKDDNKNKDDKKRAAAPCNILFVRNLSQNVKEEHLKKAFQKCISISIPQINGKLKGFAFVEFASVAEAEKALQASQKIKICKKDVKVEFSEHAKPEEIKACKTLIVMGLAERTTADTLKCAFEGALSARVAVDKETGVSKRFGFVEFESEESSKAVKEDMEDCEIDGCKVTVAYAKPREDKGHGGARTQAAGPVASRGGRGRGAAMLQDSVKEVKRKN